MIEGVPEKQKVFKSDPVGKKGAESLMSPKNKSSESSSVFGPENDVPVSMSEPSNRSQKMK